MSLLRTFANRRPHERDQSNSDDIVPLLDVNNVLTATDDPITDGTVIDQLLSTRTGLIILT